MAWDDNPPDQTQGWDSLPPTPEKPMTWLDKARQYAGQMGDVFKQQGKGALKSFGINTLTTEEKLADSLSGSAMATPEQKSGTLSRKVGGYAGDAVMLVASELLAGAPAETLVAKYGLGPVKAAMTQGALTGATYEGIRGAVQNRPAGETVDAMGKTGLAMGALGAANYPIQKAGQWLTQDVPEGLANQYVNAPPRIAQDLYESNKPSLGKQLLRRTDIGMGQSKDQVYRNMGGELADNEMLVQSALDKRVAQATPTGNLPTSTEIMPERNIPFNGTRESGNIDITYPNQTTAKDVFGVPVRQIPQDVTKSVPVDIRVPTEPTSPQIALGGFTKETPVGTQGTYKTGLLGEPVKVSNIEKPNVDLDITRKKLTDIADQQANAGFPDIANAYREVANEIGAGRNIVDMKEGNAIRREADAFVNTAHLSDPNKLSSKVDAWRIASNDLRDQIATQAPEVGGLLDRSHFLMNTRTALLPQNAGTAPIKGGGDFWKSTIRGLVGNRVGLGGARVLESVGDSGVGGLYKPATQMGLAEFMKRKNK